MDTEKLKNQALLERTDEEIEALQARIHKEDVRLKGLFKEIPDKKKKLVFSTIADVAFITVEMEELRKDMLRHGTVETYKNGENQFGQKQSVSAQLYLQMSQKLTAGMKILLDCMPKEKPIDSSKVAFSDGFEDFLESR